MLQFASSGSSAESEIAKAERMSRRNHLHDELRWRAIGCSTITKGIKTPVEGVGLDDGESSQRQTIDTCCNVPDVGGH
ncbi:hypothetical protein AVEN_55745-1 [Araneus ventricosus]|uniref:Uncharacterized protein n=1 Tax=Araneus ventricosus TaxID=182803 RepID=A0A4Y2MH25_ARAVE|nr:hypothetical protein AVEN_55745-1 [Araneus ventricosus]